MRKLKIIIERGKDNFGAYAEDDVLGVWGAGDTVEEAKQSVLNSIKHTKECNKPENVPAILKGKYEIVWHFDAESLLKYYKGILSGTGIEKITGINHKQINHYATGKKKPRPAQLKKIESALHKLGRELLAVEL